MTDPGLLELDDIHVRFRGRGGATVRAVDGVDLELRPGEVLAEGWHRGAGSPHAEVDALSRLSPGAAHGATATSVERGSSADGITVVVGDKFPGVRAGKEQLVLRSDVTVCSPASLG